MMPQSCRILVLAFALAGAARAQTILVSNLALANNAAPPNYTYGISLSNLHSTGFTTGSAATTLSSATAPLRLLGLADDQATIVAYLFSSNGSIPTGTGSGGLLATSNSVIINTSPFTNYTFTFPTAPVLAASTTYDLVLGVTSKPSNDNLQWASTTDFSETGLAGWSIANGYSTSSDSGASWTLSLTAVPHQFSLSGITAVPEPSTYSVMMGATALVAVIALRRRKTEKAGS